MDEIMELHACKSRAAENITQLWFHYAARATHTIPGGVWNGQRWPCQRLIHLCIIMELHVLATCGASKIPFNSLYPNLEVLELNRSTSLLYIIPLLPKTSGYSCSTF
jgi:hypothetical protein